jgi:hypothetical protein
MDVAPWKKLSDMSTYQRFRIVFYEEDFRDFQESWLGFLVALHVSEREVCEDAFKKTQEKQRPRKNDCLYGDVVLSIVFRRTGKEDLKERQKTLKVTRYHGARLKSTRQRGVENASNPKKSSTCPLSPCPKHSSLVIGTDRRTDIPTKVWQLFGEITRNWVKKYS